MPQRVGETTMSTQRASRTWGRIRQLVSGTPHGMAFITTLFVLFSVGMMLVGFVFMTRNEAFLATRSRNSAIAMDLAEAGAQEGLARMSLYTIVPGTSTFTNSLASTSSLSPTGTLSSQPCAPSTAAQSVTYQAPLIWAGVNLSIYPVCSTATFGSTFLSAGSQRTVRAYVLGSFKPGASNVIYTPQVNYQSDVRAVSGDSYGWGFINFQSNNAVICSGSATATNLSPPQVFAGTYIWWDSPVGGCGSSGANKYYPYECANNSMSEVAPTPCARTATLPYHFHPMVPRSMPQADFLTILNASAASLSTAGVSITQATQNAVGVPFTTPTAVRPSCSTPPCYTSSTVDKVMLVNATGQFCVNSAAGTVGAYVSGFCLNAPATLYGEVTPCVLPAGVSSCSSITRYLDWGLVQADTTARSATTFFQPPMCSAPCPASGYQNGVRYIPPPLTIDVQSLACRQNVNPGTNVVDWWGAGNNPGCSGPGITVHNAASETFTGTKSNPESLIVLNAGAGNAVQILGSPSPSPTVQFGCSPASYFDGYNWGQILATGDLTVTTNLVFSGMMYAKGNITFNADVAVWGAIYSPPQANPTSFLTNNNATVFCGATTVTVLNPLQMNYSQFAWQDAPLSPGGIR